MPMTVENPKSDFFISYTKTDRKWALWIAWILEEKGYTVVIQDWDFRPGNNFVLEMQKAAESECTIAVFSDRYFSSGYAQSEWAAAFNQDPTGTFRKLKPIRVSCCSIPNLLRSVSYIDLVDCDEESARYKVVSGVEPGRRKPKESPKFPGDSERIVVQQPDYPGEGTQDATPPKEQSTSKVDAPTLSGNFIETNLQRIKFYMLRHFMLPIENHIQFYSAALWMGIAVILLLVGFGNSPAQIDTSHPFVFTFVLSVYGLSAVGLLKEYKTFGVYEEYSG